MRTAIFIDGANIYATVKTLGFEIDYSRLLPVFNQNDSLVRAFYYTATLFDEDGHNRLQPLLDWLAYNGYHVITKPTKTFYNDGIAKVKGNMDINIAVDMLLLADKLTDVVLFSGDGDFVPLVLAVQQKGVRVTVVSSLCDKIEHSSMIADELRRVADVFIDLADNRIRTRVEKRSASASI